jgi:hypothetical protein
MLAFSPGDIVICNGDYGTVFRDSITTMLKFKSVKQIAISSSTHSIVTAGNTRHASYDEKLRFIRADFNVGDVVKVHSFGEYQIIEFVPEVGAEHAYSGYINFKSTGHYCETMDKILLTLLASKHSDYRAAYYMAKILGIES